VNPVLYAFCDHQIMLTGWVAG